MRKQLQMVLVGISILALGTTGCEQRRNTKFQQGDGEYLYSISDLTNRKVTITTSDTIKSGLANVTSARELVTPGKDDVLRTYDMVGFQLDDNDLRVDSTNTTYDFFGEPNTSYDAVYTLTENHLIVNKIARKDQLPTTELTFAVEMGNGLYRVPLFGFPIKKYVTERVEDSRGKKTDRIRSFEKKFLSEATHISVSEAGVKAFTTPDKRDLVPADFFAEGEEWFYVKTLVDRPAIPTGPICNIPGQQICNEIGMQELDGKVSFRKTQSSVVAFDLNIPTVIPDERTKQILVEIPVEWLDFRLDQEGLKEIILKDGVNGARPWENRSYAKLDLKRVANLDTSASDKNKIEYLEVSENYLGFKIFESDSQRTYFYSMARAPKNKQLPRIYPTADHKKFGFFVTMKAFMGDDLNINRFKEFDGLMYLNRIYPQNGESTIKIYLTKDSAKHPNGDYARAVQDAVNSWNEAFQAADAGFTLEFGGTEDEDRIQNGDVRYHKVAIYPEDRRSALLGYGPSVQDSTTGETFSSSNHIYLRNYTLGLKRSIQKYIYWQLGAYEGNNLNAIDNIILDGLPEPSIQSDSSPLSFTNGSVDYALIPADSAPISLKMPNPNIIKTKDLKYQGCEFLENSLPITVKMIQDKCLVSNGQATAFSRYIDQLKSDRERGNQLYSSVYYEGDSALDEIAALEDCASKLIGDKLRATLVHEFGHNFGLRHNFAASADIENLRFDPETNTVQSSASVMDYAHNDADRIINLGAYDFAAVKFAYGNKIDIVNRETRMTKEVTLKYGQSIEEAVLEHPGYVMKPYRFCTDNDVEGRSLQVPVFDPMCKKWDNGATAEANVIDILQRFQGDLLSNTKRLDRKYGYPSAEGFLNMVRTNYLASLKQIYDYYRWLLTLKNPTAISAEKYLTELSPEQVENLEARAEARFGNEFRDYKKAADKIRNFFIDLAFGESNKYCVISDPSDSNGLPYLIPFGIIREAILYQSKDQDDEFILTDCEDLAGNVAGPYWQYQAMASEGSVQTPHSDLAISSFGKTHENQLITDPDNSRGFIINEHGFGALRSAATEMLFASTDNILVGGVNPSPTVEIQSFGYAPSVADEPALRDQALRYIEDRILNGVSYESAGITNTRLNEVNPLIQPGYFPEFQSEGNYLIGIIGNLKSRLNPRELESLAISATARNAVEANNFKDANSYRSKDYAVLKIGETFFFASRQFNSRAARLIDRVNLILAAKEVFFNLQAGVALEQQMEGVTRILEERVYPNYKKSEFASVMADPSLLGDTFYDLQRMSELYQSLQVDIDIQQSLINELLILEVIQVR